MICVLGPKGGTGKTLVAANVAVALAGAGEKVAMVDLDLQFGDLGLALGMKPAKTIYDLAVSSGSLDAEKLDAYLESHDSGVRALLAPTRPDQAGAITPEFLDSVYATLRSTNDYVVLDTPPGFSSEVVASIDSSSHVCVVGMLDALSLKSTKLALEALDLMGCERERVRLVLNRADSRVGITAEDVTAILGRQPDVLVPSDRAVPRSINEGTPIVTARKRSSVAGAYCVLAEHYRSRGVGHRAGLGVASDAGVTVALELELTPELRREGTARELVRLVQDARKAAGLEVADRIQLGITAEGAAADALAAHRDEIASETLATSIVEGTVDGHREERSIEGTPVAVSVRKVG
jgi:pilus assembly protein CpaE